MIVIIEAKVQQMFKEEIRRLLYDKDGAKCPYWGIEEGDFIAVYRRSSVKL